MNFSRPKPRKYGGGRGGQGPCDGVGNRGGKIKISRAFVSLGITPIALDKYCDIISAPRVPKIELFRAVWRRESGPRRRVFQLPRERDGRRGAEDVYRREKRGARIYVRACIQLGNIISSRITTGLIIVARVAAILVSISAISGTPGEQKMARQYE